ncbi:hypothetical protein DLAC_10218 [Tieghemostelium lacteum]|uniref:Uncharacterized protein n=1 Tax=Tieghemostelium lacteum TaxID=361077 RepID=A0A151Z4W3_TIELA|nr:hypothetical protein DLAC_10218 [Tieghemostelium lacteum]|eukprot:KYQ89002.1 hypothetical protein DLAC_10218 [Tieghemostelium lacteum]
MKYIVLLLIYLSTIISSVIIEESSTDTALVNIVEYFDEECIYQTGNSLTGLPKYCFAYEFLPFNFSMEIVKDFMVQVNLYNENICSNNPENTTDYFLNRCSRSLFHSDLYIMVQTVSEFPENTDNGVAIDFKNPNKLVGQFNFKEGNSINAMFTNYETVYTYNCNPQPLIQVCEYITWNTDHPDKWVCFNENLNNYFGSRNSINSTCVGN